jgi:Ankyrin repeats (many copies)
MSLPENPNLDHLRNQARALQRSIGRPLHLAQLAVARGYGFASWAKLKHYVEAAKAHSWHPSAERAQDSLPDRFCRLACLTYSDVDGPDRWQQARALAPEITDNVWVAAAAGSGAAVRAALAEDPGLARAKGGPYGWSPLCYLAYSRAAGDDVVDAARALLDAGADPDEGYLWNGLIPPFTVLTGIFGNGELGVHRQPPHPQVDALARLVLDAGADPNDGQTLYNRQFARDDSHLELLFEYGLGRGDGGPWRRRLGDRLGDPAELLRGQLRWAVEHGMVDRVRLLVAHGVDVVTAYPDGRTPMDLARLGARTDIAEVLVSGGAKRAELDPADELIAAVFAGRPIDGTNVAEARRRRPGLIVWAAAQGRADVVAKLAELGWDVNARGRGDVPVEQEWQTALHEAAGNNDVPLIELLLSLGADRTARDARFDATPLDWARHFDHEEAVATLQLPNR